MRRAMNFDVSVNNCTCVCAPSVHFLQYFVLAQLVVALFFIQV